MEINGMNEMNPMMNMFRVQPPDAGQISTKIIDKLDTNGDGALGVDELEAIGQKGQKIAEADTDGDGIVSQDELIAKITEKLEQMGMPPEMGAGGMPDMNMLKDFLASLDGGSASEDQGSDSGKISSKVFDSLDTNEDGVISANELESAGLFGQKIAKADTDGDGSVSQEELNAKIAEKMNSQFAGNSAGGQSAYDIINDVLKEMMGLTEEQSSSVLKMLQDHPFIATA